MLNYQINNIIIICLIVLIWWIFTLYYRNKFYKNKKNTEKTKDKFILLLKKPIFWKLGHIFHYFLLGFFAPDYKFISIIIGILFEFFELYASNYIKFIGTNVINNTFINIFGVILGYIFYKIYPKDLDIYSKIKSFF